MSIENEVFRKIKEISSRGVRPRPSVTTHQIASELSVNTDSLSRSIAQLKQLRLISACDGESSSIRLTLLGSVVERHK